MLVRINDKDIVDSSKTPIAIHLSPQEISIIKNWNEEDVLLSWPQSWQPKRVEEWKERANPAISQYNANLAAAADPNRKPTMHPDMNQPEVCIHGVVKVDGSPECAHCAALRNDSGTPIPIPISVVNVPEKDKPKDENE